MDFVVDNSQTGIHIFCCFCLIASIFLESLNNKIFFKIFYCYREGQRVFPRINRFRRLEGGRQMNPFDGVVITDQYSPFHAVLQFPHIAGPVILDEQIYGGSGYPFYVLVVFTVELVKKVLGQKQNIGSSFPEWWQVDGKDIEIYWIVRSDDKKIVYEGALEAAEMTEYGSFAGF